MVHKGCGKVIFKKVDLEYCGKSFFGYDDELEELCEVHYKEWMREEERKAKKARNK